MFNLNYCFLPSQCLYFRVARGLFDISAYSDDCIVTEPRPIEWETFDIRLLINALNLTSIISKFFLNHPKKKMAFCQSDSTDCLTFTTGSIGMVVDIRPRIYRPVFSHDCVDFWIFKGAVHSWFLSLELYEEWNTFRKGKSICEMLLYYFRNF